MKLAKFLWIIASFYLLIIVFVYIVILKDAPAEGLERYEFILENWSIYNYQWKAELLMTTFLSISSFLFFKYTKNPGFIVIAVGQLFFAFAMPISIGVTPNASLELASLIGKGAHQLVNFGMLISLFGFIILHLKARVLKSWLRLTALVIAVISFLSFGAGFINLIEASDAQKAMFLVMFLYIINGYFGIKINETNANNVC
jgi:hypothetical protein